MAIAAMKSVMAAQLAEGSAMECDRSLLVPRHGRPAGRLPVLFGGLIFNLAGLFTIGSAVGIAVLFSLATLPVEIQASRKAPPCSRTPGSSPPHRSVMARGRC
jgi:Zn-dependent membrane protease YugP